VGEATDVQRCAWARDELSIIYHDTEWGVPLHDDRGLFELLILEGAQAGLSWITILKKRAAYRAAFDHFNAGKVARYDETKVAALLANSGIVRNRLKIHAAVQNAQSIRVAVRRRTAARKSLAALRSVAQPHGAIGRAEQGSHKARLQVRRLDNLLRIPAGHWHGQRSCGRLLPIPGIGRRREYDTQLVK
jgi:3-methyladenine DNA glycosylase Tag